jgi:hypothetical protein
MKLRLHLRLGELRSRSDRTLTTMAVPIAISMNRT